MQKIGLNIPLWTINFEDPRLGTDWFQRAHFHLSAQDNFSVADQKLTLNFLEKINLSFRQMTENYLHEVEKDEKMRPQVDEIRKKFDSLDKWLAWMRSQLDQPKE